MTSIERLYDGIDNDDDYEAWWNDYMKGLPQGKFIMDDDDDKEPQPVKDEKGKVRTVADIQKEIADIESRKLDVDEKVKHITDPQAQADAFLDMVDDIEFELIDLRSDLRKAKEFERHEQQQLGFRRYGMEDDEGNKAVTEAVDEVSAWYHEEVDKLKDAVAERMRGRLDAINNGGRATPVRVRDKIYDDLVDNEVIENWEPLEF